MSYNKELRVAKERLRKLVTTQKELSDKIKTEDRGFTDAERSNFNKISDQVDVLKSEISQLEIDQAEYIRSISHKAPKRPGATPPEGEVDDESNILGRAAIELRTGKSFEGQTRVVDSTSGSALIQDPNVVNNVIYSLLSDNALVKAGASYMNVDNNYQSFPKVVNYPTVSWMSQGDQLLATDPTIEAVDFNLKDVACLVRVHNNVLRDSTPNTATVIQETISRSINDAILKAAFSGSAADKMPLGLDGISGVQSFTPTSTDNHDYLIDAVSMLLDKNVPLENIGLICSPKAWKNLAKLKTSIDDNSPLMKPLDFDRMKNNGMFHVTTAIKNDYGASNDETRIYIGDFSQLAIAMQGPFALQLVEKYSDYLNTAFQVHMRCDVQAYLADNFVRIEGLSY